jgi:hypothetical protein
MKTIFIKYWDTDGDGELSYGEAAAVTDIDVFCGDTSITSLDELQYFTGVTSIGDYVFYECLNLTSITIPKDVTSIGLFAFNECRSLTSITCLATTPPTLDVCALDDTNDCPIYVPAASVDDYKAEASWSAYVGRIQAIPE